jgi:hypothetical protein
MTGGGGTRGYPGGPTQLLYFYNSGHAKKVGVRVKPLRSRSTSLFYIFDQFFTGYIDRGQALALGLNSMLYCRLNTLIMEPPLSLVITAFTLLAIWLLIYILLAWI